MRLYKYVFLYTLLHSSLPSHNIVASMQHVQIAHDNNRKLPAFCKIISCILFVLTPIIAFLFWQRVILTMKSLQTVNTQRLILLITFWTLHEHANSIERKKVCANWFRICKRKIKCTVCCEWIMETTDDRRGLTREVTQYLSKMFAYKICTCVRNQLRGFF